MTSSSDNYFFCYIENIKKKNPERRRHWRWEVATKIIEGKLIQKRGNEMDSIKEMIAICGFVIITNKYWDIGIFIDNSSKNKNLFILSCSACA